MSPLFVVTAASSVAVAGGVSKLFEISTPNAAAMHTIGWIVATTVMQNVPWATQNLGYHVVKIVASHFAGKALAKHVCNVDVTAENAATKITSFKINP
jgi:hypothetical protein